MAIAAPLWTVRFLPFADMPEQIAVISSLRHWFDPAFRVRETYTFAIGKSAYVLYHLVGAAIAWVLPGNRDAEIANLILLTAAAAAYPYALRELLRALGRDERLAIFGAAAFWSRALMYGFLPYVASVPVVTIAAALAVKQEEAPTTTRAVVLALLAVALFYLHADAFLLFAAMAIALHLVASASRAWAWDRVRATPRRLAYLLPSALLAGGWAVWGVVSDRSLTATGEVANLPRGEILRALPLWAHDAFRSHADELLTIVFWGALLLLLFVGRARSNERVAETTRDDDHDDAALVKARARDRMAFVPLACAALAYLLMPWKMGAGVMLNVRLAVFVVLYAPLLLRPSNGRWTNVALSAATLVALGLGLDATREVRAAERTEVGDLDRLLDRMPMGARVLELPFRETSRTSHWAAWQFMGAYHRARRGGVASYSFSELAHWPLQFRAGAAPPSKARFVWTFDSCLYRNSVDGPYYDFVLTRGNVDPFRDAPPGPRFVKVDAELDWTLYARAGAPGPTENPPWSVADEGPCASRKALEKAASPSP